MDNNVSSIILAAGLSSRMGELKALLDIGGKKAILRLVDENIKAGISDIVVVLGYREKDISNCLRNRNVKCVVNEDYLFGMYSSIQKGVSEISRDAKGFMIMPVDIPLIKASTIREIADFFMEKDCDIVIPYFNDITGHPPVLSVKCAFKILSSQPENGLRDIMMSDEWSKCRFDTVDEGTLYEMDNKEQYRQLLEYYSRSYAPNKGECLQIYKRCGTEEHIIRHMEAVAELACSIGEKLSELGEKIDMDLLRAAALLHDIKRAEEDHPQKAHDFLESLGYGKVADIILEHMDMQGISGKSVTEKEILYLADKMVKEDEFVGINGRFRKMLEHPDKLVRDKVEARYIDSLKIMSKIENLMPARHIYLMRHAAVSKGKEKTFIGSTDLELSDEGIAQAVAASKSLYGKSIRQIYCSGLKRAVGTAEIIAEKCGVDEVIKVEGLNEISLGEWEGKSFKEIKEKYPEEFMKRGEDIFEYKTPKGESFHELQERAFKAFENIVENTKGDILIVAHSGVNKTIIAKMLGLNLQDCFNMKQEYCYINKIKCKSSFCCKRYQLDV